MNVLEKILEEIDKLEDPYYKDYVDRKHVVEIIRSHMNDGKDTNVPSNDEIEPVSEEFLKDCAETAKKYKRENDGWIPCSEQLPEIGDDVLVQWEKYERYTGITYTHMDKMWLDSIDENGNPIFEAIGGIPNGKVIAWMPLPEPYKPAEPKPTKNTQQEMEGFCMDK